MKKHITLLVAAAAMVLAAGCSLYFGENNNSGSWSYCGQDGYYECWDNECYWRGSECPAGVGSGRPPGFECTTHTDCAAGCYCGDGYCEEAGFCTKDSDCGNGYTCNESRSSCEPQPTCTDDNQCASGQYCDAATNSCVSSCVCATDAEAKAQGFDFCDETRQTCMAGTDPNGDCAGTLTCNLGRPSCPQGQVALIADGCYTGQCQAIDSCATAPQCAAFGHEVDCRADNSCAVSYTGINCRRPDNSPCTAGDSNCTCESFVFSSCRDKTTSRTVVEYNGFTFDVSELTLRN
jgi:Cys-rich repeat protein